MDEAGTIAVKALSTLKDAAPVIAKNYPALAKFLPLFGIALHAVHVVEEATGHDTSGAVGSVASTLVPGSANAPALTGPLVPADDALDGSHVDAAADAAESDATAADAVKAVQALPDLQPA